VEGAARRDSPCGIPEASLMNTARSELESRPRRDSRAARNVNKQTTSSRFPRENQTRDGC